MTVGESNPCGGRDVLHQYSPALHLCSGIEATGRGIDHPPPNNAEFKESVQLYFYFPSVPLRQFTA
jgi:hypothetical protein